MIYLAYQTQADIFAAFRPMASMALATLSPWRTLSHIHAPKRITAALELLSRIGLQHARPAYGIERVKIGERSVRVTEEVADATPFGALLHFRKDMKAVQPRVLIVAPLSGHFSTLLRGTIRTLLVEHDVYVTDWQNARDIPLSAGRFGFDDYIEHLIRFFETIGPGAHVVAVCQPCVQVLAAVAVMAEAGHPAQPKSMALMAGPVDPRVNPTKVNELAVSKSLDWFENNLIVTVPLRYPGWRRKVYPGFVQLAAFASMNLGRHVKAHVDLYHHLRKGEFEPAAAIKAFYDEYFSVLDLPAEFYLETVQKVFQDAELATGRLTYRGRRVDPGAIRSTKLLTVEGERDDICAVGQTAAAHDLCTGLKPRMKQQYVQAGAGHYGVFSGRRWETQVYPVLRNLTRPAN